ncbi:Zinc metalloprotease rasP [Alloiococcus otitis]|uniref:Zinc metalloprotease n=1 Tax=Alloiococcus otitis ATCC 51267 TaxID=883081 RepID=K9EEI5_9LACT|nr:RIP metalloprotease RseP [Alloiococcus otitis]EKU94276.1 RIP metalloprotease RseP [Alloiococcus otitis ATCC 51267]SUU81090.1 Zinc metalloprotease rasP [Alloiococcus otitis]
MIESILIFIVVFGLLVFFHELGHFYFAKRSGILVREFSIGFGPKIFSVKKGETAYVIRLLPLGGYVMMAGYEEEEDLRPGMQAYLTLDENDRVTLINLNDDLDQVDKLVIQMTDFDLEQDLYLKGHVFGEEEETRFKVARTASIKRENGVEVQIAPLDRQFNHAPLMARILTNFAGPLNNFILAIVAFILLGFIQGGVLSNDPVVGDVQADSPASQAGLQADDRVLSVDGQPVESWLDLTAAITSNVEEETELEVQRENQTLQVSLTPEYASLEDGSQYARIGILRDMETSISSILAFGFTETWTIILMIFEALGQMFTGSAGLDQLGGPVAIFAVTGSAFQTGGFLAVLNLFATLSANLGLVNLIPIPGLDGGKLLLNFLEAIRGKQLSQEKEIVLTLVGAGFLVVLMLVVTWNDITQFFF